LQVPGPDDRCLADNQIVEDQADLQGHRRQRLDLVEEAAELDAAVLPLAPASHRAAAAFKAAKRPVAPQRRCSWFQHSDVSCGSIQATMRTI